MTLSEFLKPTIDCANFSSMSDFEIVKTVSTQHYFFVGGLVILALMLLLWFFFGFSRVSEGSKKVCFQSWIHMRLLIIILVTILVYIFWFYFPIIFLWIGG